MTLMIKAAALALLLTGAAHASPQSYAQGHQDRVSWEAWYAQQVGTTQMGADFWAGERSLLRPQSCEEAAAEPDFAYGCNQALLLLSPVDVKRKMDADYRAGWSASVNQEPKTLPLESSPLPSGPASVSLTITDYLLDKDSFKGETFIISGYASCSQGDLTRCALEDIQNDDHSIAFDASRLPRADKAMLLSRPFYWEDQPVVVGCTAIITFDQPTFLADGTASALRCDWRTINTKASR